MGMLGLPQPGMYLFVGHAIAFDVGINRAPMLLVVAEGIEDLSQCGMGQSDYNFFRGQAKFPQFGDSSYCVRVPAMMGAPEEFRRCRQ